MPLLPRYLLLYSEFICDKYVLCFLNRDDVITDKEDTESS